MLWAMLIAVEHLQITIRLTDPNLMESWSLKDYSMALLFTQNPNSPRYFGLWTRWSQEIGSSVLGILFNRVRFLRLWGLWSLFFIPRPTKRWPLVFDYSSAPRSALPTPTAQESARTTCTLPSRKVGIETRRCATGLKWPHCLALNQGRLSIHFQYTTSYL